MNTFPNKESQWKPGQSGNPAGRKKSVLKQLEKAVGQEYGLALSKEDKYHLIEWALELPLPDLVKLSELETCPSFVLSMVEAIREDIKNKRINTVEAIFDRVFGKPSQSVHHLGKDGEGIELIVTYADKD